MTLRFAAHPEAPTPEAPPAVGPSLFGSLMTEMFIVGIG